MTTDGIPATMRVVEAMNSTPERFHIVERPVPLPGPDEVLLRVLAATLNYRDLAIIKGTYMPGLRLDRQLVPASDACCVVAALGANVTRLQPGDRVMPIFTQGWVSGMPTPEMRQQTLGFPLDGVLREFMVLPADNVVRVPGYLTDVEAASLPIAALTAWTALEMGQVRPGKWVLVMGTGGVAIFALQFAKLAGAQVAVISSSDEKLDKARALGADATVNYLRSPEWAPLVRLAAGGRGMDIVVETAGTLTHSVAALALGGFIGLVGFTDATEGKVDVKQVIRSLARIYGITTGSRTSFESMADAMAQHRVRPVIDSVFP